MNESAPSKAKKTILCVDDEEYILSALKRVLRTLPFNVLTASNGEEAVETAIRERPDLILLDVWMPRMTGFEVLKQIREKGLHDTRVVMLTGAGSNQATLKGYQMGCDYYIPKPFKNESVINIVRYLIGDISSRERQELELKL
jgi:two-component system OmpR family response regulator